MIMRNLRGLLGALIVAGLLMGCAGSAATRLSEDDDCRRSGGFWTGSKCDFSGGGGGGGY